MCSWTSFPEVKLWVPRRPPELGRPWKRCTRDAAWIYALTGRWLTDVGRWSAAGWSGDGDEVVVAVWSRSRLQPATTCTIPPRPALGAPELEESAAVVVAAVEAAGCTGWTTESTVKYRVAVIVAPGPQQVGGRLCRPVGASGDRRHSHDCSGRGVGDPRVAVGNSPGTSMISIVQSVGNNFNINIITVLCDV